MRYTYHLSLGTRRTTMMGAYSICLLILGIASACASPIIETAPKPRLTADTKTTFTLEDYLLPSTVVPLHYDINLTPHIVETDFTFDGIVTITVIVAHDTKTIQMHAYNMTINAVKVLDPANGQEVTKVLDYNMLTDDRQFLYINTEDNLKLGMKYNLEITYVGILNNQLDGFYRSSYKKPDGTTMWIAATQFEPTGARRAFPCWDEPYYKATFQVTINHDEKYTVLSNMPANLTNVETTITSFMPSVQMPTYLVAFTVTDFVNVTNDVNLTYSDWTREEFVSFAEYSNSLSPMFIDIMEEYTGIDYVLSKLDQITLPDFSAGAMENWGLVTYRESALLYSPTKSSTSTKWGVASIIAHELAHQWFGDLVSPKWWSHIWLNEGFATYYSYYIVDKHEESWKYMTNFPGEMRAAFNTDSVNTSHPLLVEASSPATVGAVFDTIAYSKGACIIRMMIHLMGEENFQTGIRAYLEDMKFGNADKDDLWRNLAPHVPGTVKLPDTFATIMDTWTVQAGYPVVNVTRNYDAQTANMMQNRFLTIPQNRSEVYWIPLTMTYGDDPDFSDTAVKGWLGSDSIVVQNLPAKENWLIVNVNQAGYYRVNYDVQNWQLLNKALLTHNASDPVKITISEINRAQIMDDALALARAAYVDYNTALDTTNYLIYERDYTPWSAALSAMSYLHDRLSYSSADRASFQWYMVYVLAPTYDSVNNFTIEAQDSDVTKRLRSMVVYWTCKEADKKCLNETTKQFDLWQATTDPDVNNPIEPDLKSVVYCGGMSQGGQEESDFLLERYTNVKNNPAEESLVLTALGCATDTELLKFILSESIREDGPIRTQNARSVLSAVYNNYWGVDVALDFLLENYTRCAEVYGGFGAMNSVFSGISQKLNTQEHRNKLVEFKDTNDLGTNLAAVEAAIKTVDEILDWHMKHKNVVVSYFKKRMPTNSGMHVVASPVVALVSLVVALLYNNIV